MRRKDKEVTSLEWMESVLHEAQYLELAMCRGGEPYVVPMNFGYAPGYIVVHGAAEGQKIDILHENPNVAFNAVTNEEIIRCETNPADFSMRFHSVSGTGRAEFIEDPAEKRAALEILMKHYDGPLSPMPDSVLCYTSVIKISILSMQGKASSGV